MEDLAQKTRYVTLAYVNGEYVVEFNVLSPNKDMTLNIRATKKTIDEAVAELHQRLDDIMNRDK